MLYVEMLSCQSNYAGFPQTPTLALKPTPDNSSRLSMAV